MIPQRILITIKSNVLLSELVANCLSRVRELHPTWQIEIVEQRMLCQQLLAISDGFAHLLKGDTHTYLCATVYSALSLYNKGGFLLDADVYLNESLDRFLDFELVCAGVTEEHIYGPSILGCPPGHYVIREYINRILEKLEEVPLELMNDETVQALCRGGLFSAVLAEAEIPTQSVLLFELCDASTSEALQFAEPFRDGDQPFSIHHRSGSWIRGAGVRR